MGIFFAVQDYLVFCMLLIQWVCLSLAREAFVYGLLEDLVHTIENLLPLLCLQLNSLVFSWHPIFSVCSFSAFVGFLFSFSHYLLIWSKSASYSSLDSLPSACFILLARLFFQFSTLAIKIFNSTFIQAWILFICLPTESYLKYWIVFIISISLLFVFSWASLRSLFS